MAVVKYGAIVTEIKGKIGGTVFQAGKSSYVMRNNAFGGGRKSLRWQEIKQIFARVATNWRTLTSGQKASWLASTPDYPATNKFGDTYTPSAYQLYCTLNNNRIQIGLSMLTTPVAPVAEQDISPVTFVETDPDNYDLSFTATGSNQYEVQIFASNPVSQGVESIPSRLIYLAHINGTTSTPYNLKSTLVDAFGEIKDGSRIWLRLYVVRHASGRKYGNYTAYADFG